MGLLSRIRKAGRVAELLLRHVEDIADVLEMGAEYRKRQGRQASAHDLRDTVDKLRALDRGS